MTLWAYVWVCEWILLVTEYYWGGGIQGKEQNEGQPIYCPTRIINFPVPATHAFPKSLASTSSHYLSNISQINVRPPCVCLLLVLLKYQSLCPLRVKSHDNYDMVVTRKKTAAPSRSCNIGSNSFESHRELNVIKIQGCGDSNIETRGSV